MNKRAKSNPSKPMASNFCRDAERAVAAIVLHLQPPEDARRHFQTARLEVLKGLRALLDARIARRSGLRSKGQQINVE